MTNTVSVGQNMQRAALNPGPPPRRSGQSDDNFAKQFSEVADEKTNPELQENQEANLEVGQLPEDIPTQKITSPEITAVETDVPRPPVKNTELPDMKAQKVSSEGAANDVELPIENENAQPAIAKSGETGNEPQVEIPDVGKKADVPQSAPVGVPTVPATAGNDVSASRSQSEMAASKPMPPEAMGGRASVAVGRRERIEAAIDDVKVSDKTSVGGEENRNTVRPDHTMPERLLKKADDHRSAQEKRPNGEVNANNVAGKMDRPVNMNAIQNSFGVRGVEGRLASMMTEVSGAFEGDVKITMNKSEGHALPAMPQQLTVGGMSRTVVSQVLGMSQTSEAETVTLDAKPTSARPDKVIEVQLMPRNLGTVGITIRNIAGRVTIAIEVQGAEAERLIKTEVDKIAGAIRQAGQVVEDISVRRGVQMSQQSDTLNGDQQSGRQEDANFGQNSRNLLRQSTRDEMDGSINSQKFGEIETQENAELVVSSQKTARQGIYI